MQTFYITFAIGSIFGRYYLPVMAASENKVRAFCAAHVPGWASVYDENAFSGQIEDYSLKRLPQIESHLFLYCDLKER